ncbi:molecular chaperone DnaK, partial [bacterium]|nr:molecular chaperone DnaK [bacterium]
QIEVSFDIDANGIVHVAAKDLATGKEQSVKITASSGLSESEISKMVKDAEAHAEEDKAKKEKVNAKNNLDNLVYSTEKLLKENGDKIDSAIKGDVESAVKDAKEALSKDEVAQMKAATEKLTALSHKMAEQMYKAASAAQGGAQGAEAGTDPGGAEAGKKEDEPIEAEFREDKSSPN